MTDFHCQTTFHGNLSSYVKLSFLTVFCNFSGEKICIIARVNLLKKKKQKKNTFKLNFLIKNIISVKSALRAPAYDGSLFYYNLRSLLKFLFLKSGY